MATSLILGSSAFTFVLAQPPRAQPVSANQTQNQDQNQGRIVLTPGTDNPYNQDTYSQQISANQNGEPGTVYRSEVVTNDGMVRVELIAHPRYDDSANRK